MLFYVGSIFPAWNPLRIFGNISKNILWPTFENNLSDVGFSVYIYIFYIELKQ